MSDSESSDFIWGFIMGVIIIGVFRLAWWLLKKLCLLIILVVSAIVRAIQDSKNPTRNFAIAGGVLAVALVGLVIGLSNSTAKSPTTQTNLASHASASGNSSTSVPVITGVSTSPDGDAVLLQVNYADPNQTAHGFSYKALRGVAPAATNGTTAPWPEYTETFDGFSIGTSSPNQVTFPFGLNCGEATQHSPIDIEVWIITSVDTTNAANVSQPATAHIAC